MRPGPTARTIAMRDSLEPKPTTEFVSDGMLGRPDGLTADSRLEATGPIRVSGTPTLSREAPTAPSERNEKILPR
jgi:hypothetical protein